MTNKKNLAPLSRIDQFADVVSLTLNGRKKHRTEIGGCLTIMLYSTLLAYWVWGTLNCFNYYQPQVFTTNVPLTTDSVTNLTVTMGGIIESDDPEVYRYLSIVFYDSSNQKYYNST
jgi:hypothetical protein